MRIGIIRETKNPIDNRVALTPQHIQRLKEKYPELEFKVQSSTTRAFSDDEYKSLGIQVCENMEDCDILFGIKEANIDTLIPNKHYVFFGHIAKMQEYNKPLFRALIKKHITFSDYEYLVDSNNQRLVAFGWYAGVVGVYYTLRGWGLRTGCYNLPPAHINLTIEEMIQNLRLADLGNLKIVITGAGRVSQGAQYLLSQIGAKPLDVEEFIVTKEVKGINYVVADIDNLVIPKDESQDFNFEDFVMNPQCYKSDFGKFAHSADMLLCCHFWSNNQPVYLSEEDLQDKQLRVKMIGDITCDIKGSIKSTVRSSTHDEPYYDYNPATRNEEGAFSDENNISVMAVDTCPNALPRVTSEFFGDKLIENVLTEAIEGNSFETSVLQRATILMNGKLTNRFSYLDEYVNRF